MIVLDIETTNWFDGPGMAGLTREQQMERIEFGLAVANVLNVGADGVVYSEFRSYRPDQLPELWEALHEHHPVVGWNLTSFDLPVIAMHTVRLTNEYLRDTARIRVIDLFDQIRVQTGRWYSLDEVATFNLGLGKSSDGKQAAQWLASGSAQDWASAYAYCAKDVAITTALFWKALHGGLDLPAYAKRGVSGEAMRFRLKLDAFEAFYPKAHPLPDAPMVDL